MVSSYNLENGLPVFQALSSEVRVEILSLISRQGPVSPKQISAQLNIPVSTLTPHLRILCDCGLLQMSETNTEHGHQKRYCMLPDNEQLMISLNASVHTHSMYKAEIPIGSYGSFHIAPTCGLATPTSFIGLVDEPRYFAHPNRMQAEIVWFTSGYLEYTLPNFIPRHTRIEQLVISMELSSEAPETNNDWPSDITFSLNGTTLGTWTSPGDFGDRRGNLNPDWWYLFLNQYGLLKHLTINREGTFIDEEKLSDITTDSLGLTDQSILNFRLSVSEDAENVGGCTLFGRSFGDYRQNIQVEITYREQ